MNTSIIASATLLIVSLISGAQAEELGRLFYTREQREQIDHGDARETGQTAEPEIAPMLDGMIQRSDGSRTIWIDGVMQHGDGREPLPAKVGQRIMQHSE